MRQRLLASLLVVVTAAGVSTEAFATGLGTDDISRNDRYQYPATSAVVDTARREIRLPEAYSAAGAGLLDGRPAGFDLVTVNGNAVESYSFNGSALVKNQALSLSPSDRPLAVAARSNSADMVVLSGTESTQFNFNGDALTENPLLAVAGLTAPVQVATRPGLSETVVLDGSTLRGFSFNGAGMVENPALSINSGLTSPIAFALHPATYDCAVLDGTTVRYFNFNGTTLAENPLMSLTGLTSPVAVQLAKDGTMYVATAGGVMAYSFDGTGMRANFALSVPEASGALAITLLGDPQTLAVRLPTEVRCYQFNGEGMVENPALRLTGLALPGGSGGGVGQYAPSAVAVSKVYPVTEPVEALVLKANTNIPPGTAVSFQVSGDAGASWRPARLGKGVPLPVPLSTAGAAWKAVLSTSDPAVTPLVLPNVQLDQVWRPNAPTGLTVVPTDADGLVRTATPTLRWTFTDRDTPDGDKQSAFQVLVYEQDSGALIYNSGKISSLVDADPPPDQGGSYPLTAPDWRGFISEFTLPEGALSTGYRYRWRVRVWDSYDLDSPWSGPDHSFEVLALQNVQVTRVYLPPGETPPTLPTAVLPVFVKAGARFEYSVDSIGTITQVVVDFIDGGTRPAAPRAPAGATRNTWDSDYFTDGSLATGTVLTATFTGARADGKTTSLTRPIVVIQGSVYDDFVVVLTK